MDVRRFALLTFPAILSLIFSSTSLQASRVLPRFVAASENVRLAFPHVLSETADQGLTGLDLESATTRESAQLAATRYVQMRRQMGRKSEARIHFDRECDKLRVANSADSVMAAFCSVDSDRTTKPTLKQQSKETRRDTANLLLNEQWSAVSDIPYPSVVGIVSLFKTKSELMQMGRVLGAKSECVGSKAATAIAYKLEEYFPDEDSMSVAQKLYSYASNCGTDFASAKASYRLALLEVWKNKCEHVPALMLKVEQNKSIEANQFRARAKYWRAYCSEVLGEHEDTRTAREELLYEHPMTFQNLAANSSQKAAIDWLTREEPVAITFRSLVRPEMNNLIVAIEALIKIKAIDLAALFVDQTANRIQMFEPEIRLYIAALMHKHNQALPKFKILASLFQDVPRLVSGATMRLYFPLWFFELIGPRSGSTLDPLLVTALIRQESAFNTQARSRVGARGLMQLMPGTAKMLAKVRTNQLFDPATNITLGTQYLRKRLSQYNGDVELTLAAYNAGFSRVDEWKKRYTTTNRILFLDLIPFRETRDYVSTILRNYYWYTKLYGQDAVVALQRSINQAKPSTDLALTFSAITRAESGLVRALHSTDDATRLPAKEDSAQDPLAN